MNGTYVSSLMSLNGPVHPVTRCLNLTRSCSSRSMADMTCGAARSAKLMAVQMTFSRLPRYRVMVSPLWSTCSCFGLILFFLCATLNAVCRGMDYSVPVIPLKCFPGMTSTRETPPTTSTIDRDGSHAPSRQKPKKVEADNDQTDREYPHPSFTH